MNLKLLVILAIMATLMALTATGALAFPGDMIPDNVPFDHICERSSNAPPFCQQL